MYSKMVIDNISKNMGLSSLYESDLRVMRKIIGTITPRIFDSKPFKFPTINDTKPSKDIIKTTMISVVLNFFKVSKEKIIINILNV